MGGGKMPMFEEEKQSSDNGDIIVDAIFRSLLSAALHESTSHYPFIEALPRIPDTLLKIFLKTKTVLNGLTYRLWAFGGGTKPDLCFSVAKNHVLPHLKDSSYTTTRNILRAVYNDVVTQLLNACDPLLPKIYQKLKPHVPLNSFPSARNLFEDQQHFCAAAKKHLVLERAFRPILSGNNKKGPPISY